MTVVSRCGRLLLLLQPVAEGAVGFLLFGRRLFPGGDVVPIRQRDAHDNEDEDAQSQDAAPLAGGEVGQVAQGVFHGS